MIKTYQKFERYVYGAETISVLEWSGELPASDSIIVLPYAFHIYVCLYYARRQLCFIADGSDMFNSRYEVNAELRKLMKCNMIGCFFDQQTKLDYCGSSAVLPLESYFFRIQEGIFLSQTTAGINSTETQRRESDR